MSPVRTTLLAVLAATVLVFGASACSGDDKADDTNTATQSDTGGGKDGSPEGADGTSDGAFGLDRDAIATVLETSMPGVDKVDVDGSTLKLQMDDGSREDLMNGSQCRIASGIASDADTVLLVFPDGDFECGVDDQDD